MAARWRGDEKIASAKNAFLPSQGNYFSGKIACLKVMAGNFYSERCLTQLLEGIFDYKNAYQQLYGCHFSVEKCLPHLLEAYLLTPNGFPQVR